MLASSKQPMNAASSSDCNPEPVVMTSWEEKKISLVHEGSLVSEHLTLT